MRLLIKLLWKSSAPSAYAHNAMSRVPFYANQDDNMHSLAAAYRSILDYFMRRKISLQEAAELTGDASGRVAWSIPALVKLAGMGFDVRVIAPGQEQPDPAAGRPPGIATAVLPPAAANTVRDHTPAFPNAAVRGENRHASLEDIDQLLAEKRLVTVHVHAGTLHEPGDPTDTGRILLVTGRGDDEYIAHDPGLPPRPDRHIPRQLLWEAMGGDAHPAEVVGFKLGHGIGGRLDQYVVLHRPRLSRAYASKLISDGRVLVNGMASKAGYRVRADDNVHIVYDEAELAAVPDITLPVLYEDATCVVINKPAGVLTHSKGSLAPEATVATWLRNRLADNAMDGERAGIVHRLDRATSGVMICAKTTAALSWLQRQFGARDVQKTYYALIAGHMPHTHAIIDMPILRNPKQPQTFRVDGNGKPALTEYWVAGQNDAYTLLRLQPRTGRTHQLRVHLRETGHPIVGDTLYGGQSADRLYLHAESLDITLPDHTRRTFTAPLPPDFRAMVEP